MRLIFSLEIRLFIGIGQLRGVILISLLIVAFIVVIVVIIVAAVVLVISVGIIVVLVGSMGDELIVLV